MRLLGLLFLLVAQVGAQTGPDYYSSIAEFKALASQHPEAILVEAGTTDSGKPLHLFLMQAQPWQNSADWATEAQRNDLRLLINNAIHPGESCGLEASLLWAEELLQEGLEPGYCVAIIPVYNIGGMLQQRPHTRANQEGPDLQGFRGNARQLDLNRDFVKTDAQNTKSFQELFHRFKPQLFIDTHTSNGADYPYNLTLISSQYDKLAPSLGRFLKEELDPALYQGMQDAQEEMVPYVNVFGVSPEQGYAAFLETPRYASGYTAMFHCLGFITEAHMLKPYPKRVEATLKFLQTFYRVSHQKRATLLRAHREAWLWDQEAKEFPLAWEVDSTRRTKLDFKLYPYRSKASELGEYIHYYYDRSEMVETQIPYYPHYRATQKARLPSYYLIPQAWQEIVERLRLNGVQMQALPADTTIPLHYSYLKDYQLSDRSYEGRQYLGVEQIEERVQPTRCYQGDWLVPTDQPGAYFLASVLEPMAVDSYLAWGFFNIITQQKEYFSAYVFEATAKGLLDQDSTLRESFEAWKEAHPDLAQNQRACLGWIYRHSEYYEREHLRYPVAKIY